MNTKIEVSYNPNDSNEAVEWENKVYRFKRNRVQNISKWYNSYFELNLESMMVSYNEIKQDIQDNLSLILNKRKENKDKSSMINIYRSDKSLLNIFSNITYRSDKSLLNIFNDTYKPISLYKLIDKEVRKLRDDIKYNDNEAREAKDYLKYLKVLKETLRQEIHSLKEVSK